MGEMQMYLGMMVVMILPSLVPRLLRYRWSVRGADGFHLHGLTALAGIVLLLAGGVQFSSWKARQLALCRAGSECDWSPSPNALSAWRHGLQLGVRCSLCCGSLMLALIVVGMMDLVAMAAVTLAISAERLAPAPLRRAGGRRGDRRGGVLTVARL